MEYVIAILLGIIGSLIAAEISARANQFSRWIISRAVSRMPEDDKERYREEWTAHLFEFENERNLSKIVHALGCLFAASFHGPPIEKSASPRANEIVANLVELIEHYKAEENRGTFLPFMATDSARAELQELAQFWGCSSRVLLAALMEYYEKHCAESDWSDSK